MFSDFKFSGTRNTFIKEQESEILLHFARKQNNLFQMFHVPGLAKTIITNTILMGFGLKFTEAIENDRPLLT